MSALRPILAAAALSLAACTSVASSGAAAAAADASPAPVAEGATFTMTPGQSVAVAAAGTLRYERVVNDSRCAPDVQCVWAGDAEVAFTWLGDGGGRDAFSLHTGQGDKSHVVAGRRLALVALGRGVAPQATLRVDAP